MCKYPATSDNRVIYTVKEVAKILRVSDATVYRMISSNKLKAYRIGGAFRIKQGDIKLLFSDARY